ncbi:Transcription factor-like protein DPB [Capsicum chinense]|nr:Transcription factor-like protein DPB [Capsicum chinense]
MLNNLEDGGKNVGGNGRGGSGGGGTRSWGTTVSGQSVSTSSSIGSPSSRSEAAIATPASDSTFLRLNNLDIHADDAGSQGTAGKKKRAQRATGGDKSGRGLRQFSMKVCEKVESKGRTTYNEVADELVAEFSDASNSLACPDQKQYDEKNIRRRVYDALNVLMAMDIISKDKKEIQWKGLPRTDANDIEELKTERLSLRNRIEKKAAYLEELEEQYVGLQNLIKRNEQLYGSGNAPSGGVALPFILVQTRPHATVEVEISEDMQLVHFDFNSTPFELHDDNYVLKAMKFCGRQNDDVVAAQNVAAADGGEGSSSSMANMFQHQIPHPSAPNTSARIPTSPPVPGILKARVKHEH